MTPEDARAFFAEPVPERMTDERLLELAVSQIIHSAWAETSDEDNFAQEHFTEAFSAFLTERKLTDKAYEAGKVLAGECERNERTVATLSESTSRLLERAEEAEARLALADELAAAGEDIREFLTIEDNPYRATAAVADFLATLSAYQKEDDR